MEIYNPTQIQRLLFSSPFHLFGTGRNISTDELVCRHYGTNTTYTYLDKSDPLSEWVQSEWKEFGDNTPAPQIVVVNTSQMNAGAVARHIQLPNIIFAESGLFNRLTFDEQKAILSHETDHKLRMELGVDRINIAPYFDPFNPWTTNQFAFLDAAAKAVINLAASLLKGEDIREQWKAAFPPLTKRGKVTLAEKRHKEYLADAAGAIRVGKEHMISALQIIHSERRFERFIGQYFDEHPSLHLRIKALQEETYFSEAQKLYETPSADSPSDPCHKTAPPAFVCA